MIEQLIRTLEEWERLPLALVTMAGPWLTPLVPAYFVAVSIQRYLNAPGIVAVISGLVLEVVGIAGIANATRAYLWNRNKRKSDEAAPLWLSIAAVGVYFLTALLLTVVLEVWGELAPIAPGMFIVLSVSSGLILVLSSMQRRREQMVRQEKLERKRNRTQNRTSKSDKMSDKWRITSRTTKALAMDILQQQSDISGAELGRQLGKSERTGLRLKEELLPLIEMSKNGAGE